MESGDQEKVSSVRADDRASGVKAAVDRDDQIEEPDGLKREKRRSFRARFGKWLSWWGLPTQGSTNEKERDVVEIDRLRTLWIYFAFAFLFLLFASEPAIASRLEAAARNAQASVVTIAQITSTIGIALGGLLMSVGWSGAGRQVLGGGVVGAFASFGGPALIDFVRSVF